MGGNIKRFHKYYYGITFVGVFLLLFVLQYKIPKELLDYLFYYVLVIFAVTVLSSVLCLCNSFMVLVLYDHNRCKDNRPVYVIRDYTILLYTALLMMLGLIVVLLHVNDNVWNITISSIVISYFIRTILLLTTLIKNMYRNLFWSVIDNDSEIKKRIQFIVDNINQYNEKRSK